MDDNEKYRPEERTYTIFPNSMEPEDYLKVLLAEDVVFINNGWWRTEKGEWPEDHITIHVICNDVFAWGCADAEDLLYSEIEDLYQMWVKDPIWGPAVWCIRKRKQMPQEPVEKAIKDAGIWNLKEILK